MDVRRNLYEEKFYKDRVRKFFRRYAHILEKAGCFFRRSLAQIDRGLDGTDIDEFLEMVCSKISKCEDLINDMLVRESIFIERMIKDKSSQKMKETKEAVISRRFGIYRKLEWLNQLNFYFLSEKYKNDSSEKIAKRLNDLTDMITFFDDMILDIIDFHEKLSRYAHNNYRESRN